MAERGCSFLQFLFLPILKKQKISCENVDVWLFWKTGRDGSSLQAPKQGDSLLGGGPAQTGQAPTLPGSGSLSFLGVPCHSWVSPARAGHRRW